MKTLKKVLVINFIIIFISIILIIIINDKVMPIYMEYAESEMERVVTTVINKSVSECSLDDDMFLIKNDNNNTIVDYDPIVMNKIISNISNLVYDNLKKIGDKDVNILKKYNLDNNIFYIPTGIIFNSILLNNLGPKIPIKMELVSSVNSNLETKVTEYGINNSLIEINIKINVTIKMILPKCSKNKKIFVIIPLTVKIIQGNIPEYYFGNLKKTTK